ncbi:hypothetical protein JAAARDRAFT_350250 [Jaapia argillacea MUCL 33604]|uniref:NAD-dependent epimerase/dehydratase domain-containing protein n=1 Tax=Jaapia argillacea MUCL 33604 TaxID=933084 RepID=A0A067PWU8_9AGAM|nr:hypothetical protein JAAARDRAFT_350250 [Jaapia argillacea MUCL 33604]
MRSSAFGGCYHSHETLHAAETCRPSYLHRGLGEKMTSSSSHASHSRPCKSACYSGFIGSWVVRTLLERGYRVRATVRTQEKGQYLERLFEVYDEEFEYVIVENCTQEGAFDHVLDGIDAVEHHAYPLAGNPDDFISVAVRGTIVLLTSVLNHGHSVGRVVITSSAAAVMEPREAGHRYTEAEWNCFSVREIQAKGMKADALHKYRASKTLAEKAAWEFVSKHQDSIAWDLIAILPTIVYGPVIHQVESFEQLNYSNQLLYDSVLHERGPTDPGVNWTDVRDVAEIHVRLLEKQCAGNNRFIVSAGEPGITFCRILPTSMFCRRPFMARIIRCLEVRLSPPVWGTSRKAGKSDGSATICIFLRESRWAS